MTTARHFEVLPPDARLGEHPGYLPELRRIGALACLALRRADTLQQFRQEAGSRRQVLRAFAREFAGRDGRDGEWERQRRLIAARKRRLEAAVEPGQKVAEPSETGLDRGREE